MTDITHLSLGDLRARLQRGDVSAVDATRAYLARIEQHDPALGAYITVTPERALQQAEQADTRRAAGEAGPLLGVPVSVKDVLSTEGVPTTCASHILEGYVPPFTATSVARLEAAGAVVLGKVNMDEFAMGSSTENSALFPTRNPWDTTRVPGGSSGGSAAAVAAGLCAASLGTDTGGSVRQPGSFCGISALKPSYGRVSRWGLIAFGSSLDCVGPMARTVADVADVLQVIAGHDPHDSTSLNTPVPNYAAALTGDVRGLRVGVPKEYFVGGLQPEVEAATRAALATLEQLGATLVDISLPHSEYSLPVYYIIAPAEASANLARFDGIRFGPRHDRGDMWDTYRATRGQGFGPEVKRRIMLGTYVLSAGYYDAFYGKAQAVRTLIKQDFERAFADVDVIAGPVTPTTAFRFGENADDPLQMYLADIFTISANLAGVPGLSVPCGFDDAGLPIGLQLIGPAFGEEAVLRAGHAYQSATDWHTRRPVLQG